MTIRPEHRQSEIAKADGPMRMRDVARVVGVSSMTVSRALRQDTSIAPATRAAVLEAIAALGYVPDQMAGALSSRRSGFVAALIPSLNNPHFSLTAAALSDTLQAAGLQLLLGFTEYDRDRETALVRAMLQRKPEGIILTHDGHAAETKALLSRARIPVVQIWDLPVEPIDHVVGFSNTNAMQALVLALGSKGYRRLTYIGEVDDAGSRGAARREGYLNAMQQLGFEPRILTAGAPPVTMTDGAAALEMLLARFPDTDCAVCVSDPLAFGLAMACLRRGIAVPGNLAIAGFGDFEIGRISRPTISTVAVDASEIGRKAGNVVLSALAGQHPVNRNDTEIATFVKLRESTG
ncbi:LacI family DNA-binding transcriptional regulator [Bosea sp. R86505]|uniref:LacI family DNA-binding transcriptional regulator n=1 Tax=Bosea sp. R86505 TaxID=3101710 RepID=UPI00366D506B